MHWKGYFSPVRVEMALLTFSRGYHSGGTSAAHRFLDMSQDGAEAFRNGDYHTAIDIWEKLEATPRKADVSLSRLRCWADLAVAYRYVGNTKRQLSILRQSKETIQRLQGCDHPQYTQALCHVAEALEDMGAYREMSRTLEEASNVHKPQPMSKATAVRVSRVLLLQSRAHTHLGEKVKQLETAEQGFSLVRQHFGGEHINTTTALLVLARAKGQNGDAEEYIRLGQQVLEMQEAQLGRLNGQLALTSMELALAYRAQENTDKEIEVLEKSIDIQKRAVEPLFPPRLVVTLLHLADAHRRQSSGNSTSSLNCCLEAVKTGRSLLVNSSAVLGWALIKTSGYYAEHKECAKAEHLLLQAERVLHSSEISTAHPAWLDFQVERRKYTSL